MEITRVSFLTGKKRTLDLPITEEQLERWKGGELIQRAMPHLTVEQREFLITGSVQEEWDETFGEDE